METDTLFQFASKGTKAQAEVNKLCRTNDPETSKVAAEKMVESGKLNHQEKEILDKIQSIPGSAMKSFDFTTKDIALRMLNYPYHKAYDICRKRFSGLRDKGKIETTGDVRESCRVWRLV
jgi:hypothetical protein